jgi:hypothetical protein
VVSARLTTLLLVCACVPAACGDRADDATTVVERFQAALGARDGAAACARLNDETSSALEREEGKPCDQAVLELDLPTGTRLGATRVYVTSAEVTLPGGGALFLDEAADGWEISAAGCTPTEPGRPYDCELED